MPLTPVDPSRRDVLRAAIAGSGSLLWAGVLAELSAAASPAGTSAGRSPGPAAPHFAPKAKRVIFLYMTGGVSHVDSFDPKPKLFADHGKTVTLDDWQGKPGKFTRYPQEARTGRSARAASAGIEVSDLFPHVGACVDDLCVIRSMQVGPHQPLRGDARHAHRVVHVRPAEHRLLGELRPGDR